MIYDPILDLFRGKTITIPPLDGAFRANTDLDLAPVFAELPAADNLAVWKDQIVASSDTVLYGFDDEGNAQESKTFPAAISAIAVSPDGDLAIGLDHGELLINDQPARLPAAVKSITALDFAPDGTLWLANGSATRAPSDWVVDLMERNSSGSVWKRETGASDFTKVVGNMAFPYGLLASSDGIVVSESWHHRLVRIDAKTNKTKPVLQHIPGYPARLTRAAGGGVWMSVFAPRNRLVEMVLREKHYRFDMMENIPRAFWIAPSLSSGNSFLEPLQCGGMKLMGVHKAWSPTRSYGLVVRLDENLSPTASYHSRANGNRHGTCVAVEHGGTLFAGAKGGNSILSISLPDQESAQ